MNFDCMNSDNYRLIATYIIIILKEIVLFRYKKNDTSVTT